MTASARQVDVRGPRFAAWLTSAVLVAALLTGSGLLVAAQAALLNAATGLCLGCEMYLIVRRARPARAG